MITAFQLIFVPVSTWERISTAQRGVVSILLFFLLPLAAICGGAEVYGLVEWGEGRNQFERMAPIPLERAVRYAVVEGALLLASVAVSALVLQLIAKGFQLRNTVLQTFTAMAYGYSPAFLARTLDAFPVMNTWACWGIGAVVSVSILYHGIALILKPEQTKGFGLFLFASWMVFLLSGLSHFVALSVLRGKLWP